MPRPPWARSVTSRSSSSPRRARPVAGVAVGAVGTPIHWQPVGVDVSSARDEVLAERLNPIHREAFARSREALRELGWAGPATAYAELRGLDFEALADRARALLEATEDGYARVVGPALERAGAPPLDRLR